MFSKIVSLIASFKESDISDERKALLDPLKMHIIDQSLWDEKINISFICTHNSRRSHLAQIWMQTMAYNFKHYNINTYSGGTEATAMYTKVASTLAHQGFEVLQLSKNNNPIYAIKYDFNEPPIIGFSKVYHHSFNPINDYVAVLTCQSADTSCPIVKGASLRIALPYIDPKMYDNTALEEEKYLEKSIEIAREMWWLFV